MKFILNTTITPHFCALFSEQNELMQIRMWEQNKKDGDEVFAFFADYIKDDTTLTFLGGVAGPGGFSSLRVASGVLTACSIKYNLPIHSVLAETWLAEITDTDFLMPSFGKNVWFVHNGTKTLQSVFDFKGVDSVDVRFLQPKQQQKIMAEPQPLYRFSSSDVLQLLLLLEANQPQAVFVPAYAVPPVS
ncbi:hypothetical protein CSB37_03325 [bacterium DOLZORAL124_38_8]|nr:MAG: hypothetical protein CSB37_03325 [bacterium DOLZORAL124_38_8]